MLKGFDAPDGLKQVAVDPFQLIDMGEDIQTQHFLCRMIGVKHKPL